MTKTPKILKTLQNQGNKAADEVARQVMKRKTLLPQVLHGVSSDNKRLKNAAAKSIKIVIAKTKPRFRQPITESLLKVGRIKRNAECRNILCSLASRVHIV